MLHRFGVEVDPFGIHWGTLEGFSERGGPILFPYRRSHVLWIGSFVFAAMMLNVSTQASPEDMSADPTQFLKNHCFRCHGEKKQKSDRRFDHLGMDLNNDVTAFEWQEILDMINLGEMPPADEDQPTDEELQGMVSWITPKLESYYALQAQRQTTGLRRLNRFQYKNTIEDLLGINMASFDPTASFPSDDKLDGFENIASKLLTSRYLIEQYLEVASAAIGKVIDIPVEPPGIREYYEPDDFWGARREFRPKVSYLVNVDGKYVEIGSGDRASGRLYPRSFNNGVPVDGYYTITVKAEGVGRRNPYDKSLFKMDFEEPIKMEIFANNAAVENPRSANPSNRKIKTVTLEDNTPREYKVRVWLDQGYNFGFRYANGPVEHRRTLLKVQETYHPETIASNNRDVFADEPAEPLETYLSEVYAGPRVRIYTASIEGPEADVWPPQNYRELLGTDIHGKIGKDPHQLIHDFARKAFRGPVLREELALYQSFYDRNVANGSAVIPALADTYKGILCSPNFLYIEAPLDESFNEGDVTLERMKAYTLASRLSYFLWGSMPDRELLAAAERGVLSHSIELRYQALRMLRDPRAEAFVEDFTNGWLGLSSLAEITPDANKFEFFSTYQLGESMQEETRAFFRYILKDNRKVEEFLNGDYSFIDRKLAKHYGVDYADFDDEHQRVSFPPDSVRGGLLGHAGVLTVTANGVDTSPVVRGIWILENLLGTPPSPPPPDVPALEPDIRGATSIRDQLSKHREIATCNECHRKIDPLGFALESFDAVGAFRDFYLNGKGKPSIPIDTSGKLPSGEGFEDVRGLKEILLERKDQFVRCLTEKLLMYALGRELTFHDRPQVNGIMEELERRDGGLQDLVELVVTSETFLAN